MIAAIDLTRTGLSVTRHAVDRWRERVADVAPAAAFHALEALVRTGRTAVHLPAWVRTRPGPSSVFVANDSVPDVLLAAHVEHDGLLIVQTVLTPISERGESPREPSTSGAAVRQQLEHRRQRARRVQRRRNTA